jgi:hypothetical protein
MLDKVEGVEDQLFCTWSLLDSDRDDRTTGRPMSLGGRKWSMALMPTATVLILASGIEMTLPVFMSLLP